MGKTTNLILLLVLFCFSSSAKAEFWSAIDTSGDPLTMNTSKNEQSLGEIPKPQLSFTQNRGQWPKSIEYQLRAPEATLWYSANSIQYQFSVSSDPLLQEPLHEKSTEILKARNSLISVTYLGASTSSTIISEGSPSGLNHFMRGNNPEFWYSNVPSYISIIYQDIYEGVDIRHYVKDGELEYDIILQPGASIDKVQLSYNGILSQTIDHKGNLVLDTEIGRIIEHKPIAYQMRGEKRIDIACNFILSHENVLGFSIQEGYDQDLPLIIDPILSFSSYLGGSNDDNPYSVAIDDSGNVYIAGSTESSDFPMVSAIDNTLDGASDIFVTKLTTVDSVEIFFSTFIGGSSDDRAYAIAVDSIGNAYLTGFTKSSDFPLENPIDASYGGGTNSGDAFVLKLSLNGDSILYSTFLGGSNNDQGRDIEIDDLGNAYVVGYTASSDFPLEAANDSTYGGGSVFRGDAFISKVSNGGDSLIFSTYLGGTQDDVGFGLATDDMYRIYVTGSTTSSDFPFLEGVDGSYNGGSIWGDAFITRFSASGLLEKSTFVGGTLDDWGFSVDIDESDRAYVTGSTKSGDFPMASAFDGSLSGSQDGFVLRIDSSFSALEYATYLGGAGVDEALDIKVKGASTFICGTTASSDFPLSQPYDSVLGGSNDVFLSHFDSTGTILKMSTYIGGTGALIETSRGMAVDNEGHIWLTGFTSATDFPLLIPFLEIGIGQSGFVIEFIPATPDPSDCLPGVLPTPLVEINPRHRQRGVKRFPLPLRWEQHGEVAYMAFFDEMSNGDIGVGGAIPIGEPVLVNDYLSAKISGMAGMETHKRLTIRDDFDIFERGRIRFQFIGNTEYADYVHFHAELKFHSYADYEMVITESDGDDYIFAGLIFHPSGIIELFDQNNPVGGIPGGDIGVYIPGQTLHINFFFDPISASYDVWLNFEKIMTQEHHGITTRGIGGFEFLTQVNAQTGRFDIYDLEVHHETPCPTHYTVKLDEGGVPSTEEASGILIPAFNYPSILSPNTEYTWSVDASNGDFFTNGPFWAFKTEAEDEDNYEVGDEYVQYYPTVGLCVDDQEDNEGREDDATDFSSKLNDDGWNYVFSNNHQTADAEHFLGANDAWIDDVDFVYFSGHAVHSLEFNSFYASDCDLIPSECIGLWGESDLEWMAWNGQVSLNESWAAEWGMCLNGMHLICGNVGVRQDRNFGDGFAHRLVVKEYTIPMAWYWEVQRSVRISGWAYWEFFDSDIHLSWLTTFLLEDKEFFGDHIWGHGTVFDDPDPDDIVYFASGDKWRKPSSPGRTLYASNPTVGIGGKYSGNSLEVLTRGNLASTIIATDSLREQIVTSASVGESEANSIAANFCGLFGVFCDDSPILDTASMTYDFTDDEHRLLVYQASGGWEYQNNNEFFSITDSVPSLLLDSVAVDSLRELLNSLGVHPTDDAAGGLFNTLRITAFSKSSGDTIPDSSYDIAVFGSVGRELDGLPVVGPGAIIDGSFGHNGVLTSIGYGAWRDVIPGDYQIARTLEDVLSDIALNGSDAVIGTLLPCDTIIVEEASLGFYEPYSDTTVDKLQSVWLILGLCINGTDTLADLIIAPAVASCCVVPGDADHNGTVDITDLTYTVDYMFRGGPAPVCSDEADVNGDGAIDIADLTYRVDFMFRGGPAMVCGNT